jgi:DNA-binding IclR family transcriptional regulator
MSNGTQAVDRALQILQAFSARRVQRGVTELARDLGVHVSTASRLAATLEGRGFLERVPGNRAYQLGPEVGRLGLLALGRHDLLAAAWEPMERLAARTGETVNLAVLDRAEAVNIAQVDGPHIIGVGQWAGRRNKLHGAANGKVLLAFGGAEVGKGALERFTARTITDAAALRAEIGKVRRQGWAMAVGELEDELNAVAAPVFDARGLCRAALSVSGPSYRVPPKRLREMAALCVKAAEDIGQRLGRTIPRSGV